MAARIWASIYRAKAACLRSPWEGERIGVFLVSVEILMLFLWGEFDSYSSVFDALNGK